MEELTADRERLKEPRRQCKTERLGMGDVLCDQVSEAANKRFFGNSKAPYTPPASTSIIGVRDRAPATIHPAFVYEQ